MECKCILLRKRPSHSFMHSLCKNENIPMWGKHRCRITKEIAIHLTRIITKHSFNMSLHILLNMTGVDRQVFHLHLSSILR